MVSRSVDRELRVFDLSDGEWLATVLDGPGDSVADVFLSDDGREIRAVDVNGRVDAVL